MWYGKEYAAELGILFEEEDEVATVPTDQQDNQPSFDDIEEISLEEVDRILQQNAATVSSNQQPETCSTDEQQTDRQPEACSTDEQQNGRQDDRSNHPYYIDAERAAAIVGPFLPQPQPDYAVDEAEQDGASKRFVPMSKRKPKAKRGVPQEGLKTIDPSEFIL